MTTAHNQPQYDFLIGSPQPSSVAGSSRHGVQRVAHAVKPDATNEEWRTQIHKLQYEVDSLRQEQSAAALRYEEELRRAQAQAESDYKRSEVSESSTRAASARCEALVEKLREAQDEFASEKRDLEKRVRQEQEENDKLREELEDLRTHHSAQERQFHHDLRELEVKLKTSQQRVENVGSERDEKATLLQISQSRLSQREIEIGDFENEILQLKTQTGDADAFAVIKRELADQVTHIKELEATNLDQRIELKQFRKQQKAIDIVEEEKRALESKVRMMTDLRRELREAQLQRQILEQERSSWTSYLEKAALDENDLHFSSPEDLAKAFVKERFENAALVDQLGKVSPELTAKDDVIRSLEEDTSRLKGEIAKMSNTSGTIDVKARTRLERQRTLALKEAEYLRAQLNTFETEETDAHTQNIDEQKRKRISDLEDLVKQYREEVLVLQDDLSKYTVAVTQPEAPKSSKREHDHDGSGDERLGELIRKNRVLRDSLAVAETANIVTKNELEACKSQLESVKMSARTRVLELRDNPTSRAESIKQSSLDVLRAENAALLSQIENASSLTAPKDSQIEAVPVATLNRLRGDMAAQNDAIASKDKHALRLKQIFSSKSREFREAVASILGWKFDFMPNGRVRVTSLFNPGISEDEGGEGSNSIVFDGDNETMKVSGGPQSGFAGEIRPLVEFWVDGRNEIPCFLAACTLEFWEKSTRAQKA